MECTLLFVALVGFIIWMNVLAHQDKQRKLRALQVSDIDNMTGHQFEQYVAVLLRHQGFSANVTVGSGDLGVDVVASRAMQKYAVQVKRQVKNVSRRAVSDAVAGKHHYKCEFAMVVTNAYFTPGAKTLAQSTKCRLGDRDELVKWIIDYQKIT